MNIFKYCIKNVFFYLSNCLSNCLCFKDRKKQNPVGLKCEASDYALRVCVLAIM